MTKLNKIYNILYSLSKIPIVILYLILFLLTLSLFNIKIGIILHVIIFFPLGLVFLIVKARGDLKKDYLFTKLFAILKLCSTLIMILFFAIILSLLFMEKDGITYDVSDIWGYLLNFSVIIVVAFVVNYFVTPYSNIRISIEAFFDSINAFLNKTILLDVAILVLIIVLDKELRLAIITSYVFYALTEIVNTYNFLNKKRHGIRTDFVNIKINDKESIMFQILINFSLIYIFINSECLLLNMSQEENIDYDCLILKVVISLSIFCVISVLPYIFNYVKEKYFKFIGTLTKKSR